MSSVDTLSKLLSSLPPSKVAEVVDFAQFLAQKQHHVLGKANVSLLQFSGALKTSKNFNTDPLEWQKNRRDEW